MRSRRLIFSRIVAGYRISSGVLIAFLLAACLAAAQDTGSDLSRPLALDPAVRTGTLPNGLTYFIRRNGRPQKRAALRLAVQAGSIDEDDDQRGLAHMLEHMAFNGTAHFKPGELVAYLESIGASFGPHVNAYTSYDETVYMLDVPTDREGLLDRGFVALSDFAGGMTLDAKEIDRERGVVIEEWRGRQGAGSRMQSVYSRTLYGASKYVDRLPIGTPEVLKTFSPQRLRDFYERWYRPDRMAVIVVGDLDPAAAEALITRYFSPLKRPASNAPRPVHPVPPHAETRYGVATDPEAQESSVSVVYKSPLVVTRTVGDYRRTLVRALVHQMLNGRFGEIARQTKAPFLGASSEDETIGRTVEAFSLSARVQEGGIPTGLTALAQETSRVRRFGFGDAELDRGRKWMLSVYERAYNERDKSENASFAGELVRYFINEEPLPGIQEEYELARRFLPTITAAEAATMARTLVADTSQVVIAVAPTKAGTQKDGGAVPTEDVLRAAMQRGLEGEVTAWADDISGRELIAKKPVPGSVAATRTIPELGVTVLSLSNGVEVWLKPTDFKNDQVLFTSYAKGGTSLASPDEYQDAALSATLVSIGGIGGFTPVELEKLLPGQLVSVSADVSAFTHGVSGSSTPRDLETALQLMYLYFTAPNRTPEAFELLRRRLEAALANRAQSPGAAFGERVRQLNTMNHYSSRALTPEDVTKLRPDLMRSYYDARFANAADFTFFFAGAFTVDTITPLVNTYVASLPSTGKRTAVIGDAHLQFPPDIRRETVRKGKEPRSQTVISFFADTGLDELEMHRARAATYVLEIRLRDLLREELGGTYSVNVGYTNTQPQPGYGTMSVQFGSAPENADKLAKAVFDEVSRLQREGPSAGDMQKIKEIERRGLETSVRQNGYWMNSLYTVHLLGWDPRRITQRFERIESLTGEQVQAVFTKYFPMNRYTIVTLMPETTAP